MRALVSGGTGFIGGNLVRALLGRGFAVRVLLRPGSSRQALEGLDVELAFGDLTEPASLVFALQGCEVLFHAAAVYALWTPDPEAVYAANVQGTRDLLRAAHQAGIQRVVYTSSESTIGLPPGGGFGHEGLQAELSHLPGVYKKSKLLAEREAMQAARDGLPIVIVNPTTPVGPGDVKPTPTGRIVLDFLDGKMPGYTDTGLNLVDVRDVAEGHILALEKGRLGERYILGSENLALRELLEILARLAGRPAPGLRIPFWLAYAAAYGDELRSEYITHRPPRVPLAGVKAARKYRFMDCSKAAAELDFKPKPVEAALRDQIAWFRENGYVKKQGRSS